MAAEPDCTLEALDAELVVADGDIVAVVLFADVDPDDRDAVARRVADYEGLFGAS